MVDVSTWPKMRQYEWTFGIIWGKMCSTVDAKKLAARCPDIYEETGYICPVFNETDVANIVKIYMSIYPEHIHYEERLKWIIRCSFGASVPVTPPGVLSRAPYIPKRPWQEPAVTPEPATYVYPTQYITRTITVPVTQYVTKTVPVSVPVTEYVTRTVPITVPYTIEVTRPYTVEVPRPYTVEIPVQVPYTVEVPVEVPSELKAEGIPSWIKIGGIGLLAYFFLKGGLS